MTYVRADARAVNQTARARIIEEQAKLDELVDRIIRDNLPTPGRLESLLRRLFKRPYIPPKDKKEALSRSFDRMHKGCIMPVTEEWWAWSNRIDFIRALEKLVEISELPSDGYVQLSQDDVSKLRFPTQPIIKSEEDRLILQARKELNEISYTNEANHL